MKTNYISVYRIFGMRIKGWPKGKGERIELTLEKVSEHQTKVHAQSQSRLFWGLVDRGQNTVNIERLKACFSS